MSSYLFLLTIGPVQAFISQARKTQDLYAGSQLLSELINEAMKKMPNGSEFIFPAEEIVSKPNRFIATIKLENAETVKKLGNDISEKVKEKFKEISGNQFKKNFNGKSKPTNFDKQIKDHLQIYWVALKSDGKNYHTDFKKIESSLGAVKNIRAFDKLDETGRKCSLCGERNALIFNSSNKNADVVNQDTGLKKKYFQEDSVNINSNNDIKFSLSKGEGLCAVCFTKRFYEKAEFPSTAEIALMDSIDKIKNLQEGKKKNDNYKSLFVSKFDYQLYYDENLKEKYFEKQFVKLKNGNDIDKVLNENRTLKNIAKDNGIKLSKHYALIMFDGDSMGEWLSGKHIKDTNKLKDFHNILSSALGDFAKTANDIIQKPKGKIVFAGGEDFLGLINLNHLFDSLKLLRELFDCKVNQKIKEFMEKENDMISFSAGIVIAHYKMPFSEILKWGRATEKEAKDIDAHKNAFAINVLKHSGEIEKCIMKWGDDKELTQNINLIGNVADTLVKDEFSGKFIKNLELEFRRLADHEGKLNNNKMVESEIKRLVKNSCKLKENKSTAIEKFSNAIIELYNSSRLYNKDINNFFSALSIAEFISRDLNGGNE